MSSPFYRDDECCLFPLFLTENILSSDRFPIHINTLMSKLTDSNPYISLMSHLIALGLIRKLSGEHQLEVAHRIIDTMKLEQLSGIDTLSQEENTHEVSSARNCFDFILTNVQSFTNSWFEKFTNYIISRPNSKTALHCVQITIVAAISQISRPTHLCLNWLIESNPV